MRARMNPVEAAGVLGVPLDASLEDIQHAYLRAARQVHPDVLPDASEPERAHAALRFDELSQAREVLFEHRPLPEAETGRPGVWHDAVRHEAVPREAVPQEYGRGRGIGGSLAVLALLVFLLIAIVSLNDAFRASTAGRLDQQGPQVSTSAP